MPAPRRPLAVALCAALVAILLGASAGPGQANEGVRLTVATASTGGPGQHATVVKTTAAPDVVVHLDLLAAFLPVQAVRVPVGLDDSAADGAAASGHDLGATGGRGPPRA